MSREGDFGLATMNRYKLLGIFDCPLRLLRPGDFDAEETYYARGISFRRYVVLIFEVSGVSFGEIWLRIDPSKGSLVPRYLRLHNDAAVSPR